MLTQLILHLLLLLLLARWIKTCFNYISLWQLLLQLPNTKCKFEYLQLYSLFSYTYSQYMFLFVCVTSKP